MPLTDAFIKKTKPQAKSVYLTHRGGLQLSVEASGSHFWRFCFRFKGLMQTLCLGKYPAVSIRDAEEKQALAREQIKSGINPVVRARNKRHQAKIARLTQEVKDAEAALRKAKKRAAQG